MRLEHQCHDLFDSFVGLAWQAEASGVGKPGRPRFEVGQCFAGIVQRDLAITLALDAGHAAGIVELVVGRWPDTLWHAVREALGAHADTTVVDQAPYPRQRLVEVHPLSNAEEIGRAHV